MPTAAINAYSLALAIPILLVILIIFSLFRAVILMLSILIFNSIAGRHSSSYRVCALSFGKALLITLLRLPLDFVGGFGAGLILVSIGAKMEADVLTLRISGYFLSYLVSALNLTALLTALARITVARATFIALLCSFWLPILAMLFIAGMTLVGWTIRLAS